MVNFVPACFMSDVPSACKEKQSFVGPCSACLGVFPSAFGALLPPMEPSSRCLHTSSPPRCRSQPSVFLFTLHTQCHGPPLSLSGTFRWALSGSLCPHPLHCHNTTDLPTPCPPQATAGPTVRETFLFHLLQTGFAP